MQEPLRLNLSTVMQKSMRAGQKKCFLHRIIYIASYTPNISSAAQDGRAFIILMESNIKLINEDFGEEPITGFGVFYTGFFINIVEGPEELLVRHIGTLLETFDKDLSSTPEVTRMKILIMAYHINKRYYTAWEGRQATPPVLLDKIEPTTSPEINSRHVQNCIMKLYRMSQYLRSQPPNLLRAAMDNISDLCRQHLPEVNLLDFLLDSPALLDATEFVRISKMVPDFTLYHEKIWPLTSDFVPTNILGETVTKKLMSLEEKEPEKEPEKEAEEEEVTEGN